MLHGNFLAMGNRSAAMVPGKLSQNARGWQACFGQPFFEGPGRYMFVAEAFEERMGW